MAQGRSLILQDPSRLGRCCLCAAWFLKAALDSRVHCDSHSLTPPPFVSLVGMDPHFRVLPLLLNYAHACARQPPDEPLFPALCYKKVSDALGQVAQHLGIPRNLLCTHSLRRGGTCDKARAVDSSGQKLYEEVNLGVFGRWNSKIWHVVYAELVYGQLLLR